MFVYIPPFAELRGGAWVVVDSTINADVMEFYAAEDARGGVLEAAGAASIKFRDRDIIGTAHRLDHQLISLDESIALLQTSLTGASVEDSIAIKLKISELGKQIKTREKLLFGVYQQVAVHFADLHDTPGRMKAKGVIKKQVPWKESRSFFYWRLQRRLKEFELANSLDKSGSRREILSFFYAWFLTVGGTAAIWENDRQLMQWLGKNQQPISDFVQKQKLEQIGAGVQKSISDLFAVASDEASIVEALRNVMSSLTPEQRAAISSAI